MKAHKIQQHVIHANGYTINYKYINTNVYTQYTKNNYSQSGYARYSNQYKQNTGYARYSDQYKQNTGYARYSNQYAQDTGYTRYSDKWDENWSKYANWQDWPDTWTDGGWPNTYTNATYSQYKDESSGYSAYSNHAKYTNGYSAYSNHANYTNGYAAVSDHTNYTQAANQNSYNKVNYTQEVGRTPQNVTNNGPTLSGAPSPNSGILNRDTVTLDWSGVTYSDNNTTAATKYRVYYSYCATQNGTYGNWTLLSEQTAKTYNWSIKDVSKGYYRIGVTAYDGGSWSALPTGNTWTFHYINNTTAAVHVDPGSTIKTISYALGGPIKIVHYDPPTWLNEYYTKAAMDQLVEETNKSRAAFDLSGYSFATTNYVANFTIITLQDFKDLNTANNETYHLYKNTNYTFTSGVDTDSATNSQNIVNQAITDIRDLIDHLKD